MVQSNKCPSIMMTFIKKAIPLLKWFISGGLAIVVDVSLLYVLVEIVHLHYLLATSGSFLVSATTNYTISSLAIFKNAQHSIPRSYITFMGISLIGLAVITICMYIFVDILHIHYLVSRLFLAGTLGVSSFFLHKYISFKDVKPTTTVQ